jgi:hypothetical protein
MDQRFNIIKQQYIFHAVSKTGEAAPDTALFTEDQLIQGSLTVTAKIMSPEEGKNKKKYQSHQKHSGRTREFTLPVI